MVSWLVIVKTMLVPGTGWFDLLLAVSLISIVFAMMVGIIQVRSVA